MKRPPEPTTAEFKRWGRLAALAVTCGDNPGLATGDLAEAARLARKSCVPGVLSHDNPFVKMQCSAVRFVEATTGQRREQAPELKARGEECCHLLDAMTKPRGTADPPPDNPARPFRADIDG